MKILEAKKEKKKYFKSYYKGNYDISEIFLWNTKVKQTHCFDQSQKFFFLIFYYDDM